MAKQTFTWLALVWVGVAVYACAPDLDFELHRPRDAELGAAGSGVQPSGGEPFAEGARELALLSWNIEWFQDPARGPADDALQFEAARELLGTTRFELAGLQEIVSSTRLSELVASLPGRAVVIANYAWEQKTALVYDSALFTPVHTELVRGLDDAGRPPLAVELVTREGDHLLVLVVHAKAGGERASYARRERFAAGLVQYLDARRAGLPVIVLGDFNDRFSGSIVPAAPSPYESLLRAGYSAPTAALESGAERSTVWGETVDHVLLSSELEARVRVGSVAVLRDEWLARYPDFFDRVSDHAAVSLRLSLPRE